MEESANFERTQVALKVRTSPAGCSSELPWDGTDRQTANEEHRGAALAIGHQVPGRRWARSHNINSHPLSPEGVRNTNRSGANGRLRKKLTEQADRALKTGAEPDRWHVVSTEDSLAWFVSYPREPTSAVVGPARRTRAIGMVVHGWVAAVDLMPASSGTKIVSQHIAYATKDDAIADRTEYLRFLHAYVSAIWRRLASRRSCSQGTRKLANPG